MEPENVEVETSQGKLKGLLKKSEGLVSKTYYSFQGIPYAKPPVGQLRFKAPEPFGRWGGTRDATKEGNDTLQFNMFVLKASGDEDCLYLNVYSPQLDNSAKKAVMVWIHGGGFQSGSGSSEVYGPDYFVEKDVVLVTINYRCGALGFLSLESEKLPGNNGLKDQALALQWVQQNISSFGGDPENVTIFGESAGGASVNYLLLSPLSRGLFHKAILQSGFSICQWAFQQRPKEKALLFAKELGCTSQDPDEVFEYFMSVPAKDFVNLQYTGAIGTNKEKIQALSLQFLPCVEVVGESPFLPDHPHKMMERGDFAKVPLIMGVTDKEGLLAIAIKDVHPEVVNGDVTVMVPLDIQTKRGSEEEKELGREILKFYTNQDTLTWDVVHGYVDFVSDIGFCVAFEKSRQYFLSHCDSKTPVYTYQFTHISTRALLSFLIQNSYPEKAKEFVGIDFIRDMDDMVYTNKVNTEEELRKRLRGAFAEIDHHTVCNVVFWAELDIVLDYLRENNGACHADEIVQQFKSNSPYTPFVPPNEEDRTFIDKFVKVWTNFAKSGNPNSEDLGVTWKSDNIQNPHYIELGSVWRTIDDISFPKRMEFWKKLYEKYSYCYK